MTTLVTGAAGFIGHRVAGMLLDEGHNVVGVDNINDYYNVALKNARLAELLQHKAFRFEQLDLANIDGVAKLFQSTKPARVIHLAAQAGVRYSLENPLAYADSNLSGFLNILEGCRHHEIAHLVFASSSSVYGSNTAMPYREDHHTDHPLSLYGATKKSNEMMAHAYAHLYGLPTTGLRFFTVYGPWGRPDMSPMLFAERILKGTPIDVFNEGNHSRDFTFIDDIAKGVIRVSDQKAVPDANWSTQAPTPSSSAAPYRIFNIGNGAPIKLMEFIGELERAFGRKAKLNLLPMQPGDVVDTWADTSALEAAIGFKPATSITNGIDQFANWYRTYYDV